MKVDIEWFVSGAKKVAEGEYVVVVIDAVRASCFIVEALARGVSYIVPVSKVKEAWSLKEKMPDALLAGEVGGDKIEGFDLGPSPLKLRELDLRGRIIVYRTSSGTQVLYALRGCDEVYVASFPNIGAVGRHVYRRAVELERDIVIVLAGFMGERFALEDFLCAGGVVSYLPGGAELSDEALAAKLLFKAYEDKVFELVTKSKSAVHVSKLGYRADIEYCSKVNLYSIVPQMKKVNGLYAVTI